MHKESTSRLCGYKLCNRSRRTFFSWSLVGTVTSSVVSRLDDGVEVAGLPCPTPCYDSSRRRLSILQLHCKSQTILPGDLLNAFSFFFFRWGVVSGISLSFALTGHVGEGESREVW